MEKLLRYKGNKNTNIKLYRFLRTFADGPNHEEIDDKPGCSGLVTNVGHPVLRDEEEVHSRMMPLSAWTIQEMLDGMKALRGVPKEIVDIIYDTIGRNYRKTKRSTDSILTNWSHQNQGEKNLPSREKWKLININNSNVTTKIESLRRNLDIITTTLGVENFAAYLSSTQMQGHGIDRLRSMYAKYKVEGKDDVITIPAQYLASAYMTRSLRTRVTLHSVKEALAYAKIHHSGAAYGWHFEYFGHMIFHKLSVVLQLEDNQRKFGQSTVVSKVHRFKVVEGNVSKLNRVNLYWTPDTSNFSNIDAAIAIGNVLYCLQYTISFSGHGFNYSTFVSKFWEKLEVDFKNKIQTIKVLFVLPGNPAPELESYNVLVEKTENSKFFRHGNGIVLKTEKQITKKASSPPKESNGDVIQNP